MRVNSDSVSHLHVLSVSDRNNPEGRPKHWLLVDRQEKPEIKAHANKMPTATLEIAYQLIVRDHRRIRESLYQTV